MLFKTGLFFHITGIFMIAGGSLGTLIAESAFWKNVQQGNGQLRSLAVIFPVFSKIIIGGVLLMLGSGVLMLYGTSWIFWGQPWLTLKLFVFVLMVLNGRFTGRRITSRIVEQAMRAEPDLSTLATLKKDSVWFHVLQYMMLLTLVTIVIFFR